MRQNLEYLSDVYFSTHPPPFPDCCVDFARLTASVATETALAERLRAAQAALQPADDEVARVAELKQELVRLRVRENKR